ncbi:hypothetical protein D3C86_1200870 [compost metagenome]
MGGIRKAAMAMVSVVEYNRKPIPLRPILRVEERKGIKTLAGLRRAILAEMVANWRQVEEIERREAVAMLKHDARMDDLDYFIEQHENRRQVYHNALALVIDELFELQRRTDAAAARTKRQLRRTQGAYMGLIAQHQARADEPQRIGISINEALDEKLEELHKLKEPRLKRSEELLRMLDTVKADIAKLGEHYPLSKLS